MMKVMKLSFQIALKGFSKGSIVFDNAKQTWLIIDEGFSGYDREVKDGYKIQGIQSSEEFEAYLPTGLHSWQLLVKDCNETRNLILSSVSLKLTCM